MWLKFYWLIRLTLDEHRITLVRASSEITEAVCGPKIYSLQQHMLPQLSHRLGRFDRRAWSRGPSLLWPLHCGTPYPRMLTWHCLYWYFAMW